MDVLTTTLLIASGFATRYAPDVMPEVVAQRVQWGHVPPDSDPARCVALLDCDLLGREVWLQTPDGRFVRATVADCAQGGHRDDLARRGWAVDLAYALAVEIGMPLDDVWRGVRVWSALPAPAGVQ